MEICKPSCRCLPQALVKARIAAGLWQAYLASRPEKGKDGHQRHESHAYPAVRVRDVLRIAGILGIEIRGDPTLAGFHASATD